MKNYQHKSQRNAENQSPSFLMGDLSFLLLIVVVITIIPIEEQGINVRLAPWDPEYGCFFFDSNNIFYVHLNSENQLFAKEERIHIDNLKSKVKNFIMNPSHDGNLASAPSVAIVSFQFDCGTSYAYFIAVYDELKAAYRELWEAEAKLRFGKSFNRVSKEERKAIKDRIPYIMIESPPIFACNYRDSF